MHGREPERTQTAGVERNLASHRYAPIPSRAPLLLVLIVLAGSVVSVCLHPVNLVDPTFNAQAALIETLEFQQNITFASNGTHDHYTVVLASTPGYLNISHGPASDASDFSVTTRNIQDITIDIASLYNEEKNTAFVSPGAIDSWFFSGFLPGHETYTINMNTDVLETVTITNLGRMPTSAAWNGAATPFSITGTTITASVPDNGADILEIFFTNYDYRAVSPFSVAIASGDGWEMVGFPVDQEMLATEYAALTGADIVAVMRDNSFTSYFVGLSERDFTVYPREAVYLHRPSETSAQGDRLTSTSATYSATWNGLCYVGSETTASDFAATHELAAVARPSGGTYQAYYPGLSETDFAIAYGDPILIYPKSTRLIEVSQ